MTDDELRKKVDELHRFWMQPTGPGAPSRAQEFDEVLRAVRAGRLGVRALLYLCGAVISISATVAAVRGWKP